MANYWYVDTASSGGDGTTRGHSGATSAYASLSSWESSEAGSPSTPWIVRCAGSTADSTAVNFNGGSYTANNTLTVIADQGEDDSGDGGDDGTGYDSDGFYDGDLVWSTSHYRLSGAHSQTLFLNDPNIILDGLQVESTHTSSFRYAINIAEDAADIRNCRITRSGNGSGSGHCIFFNNTTHRSGGNVYNCIVFDTGTTGHGINMGNNGNGARTFGAFNNVVFDCDTGINWHQDHSNCTYRWENNALYNNTTNHNTTTPTNATVNHDYNAISDASNAEANGVANLSNAANTDMVDPGHTTMKSRNVRPYSGGRLENAGLITNTLSTDFYGTSRATPPEIGIAELAAAGDTTITVPDASLGYTMQVPTVGTGAKVTAPDASLAYTMQVPTVGTGVKVTAPDFTLTLTCHVPTVSISAFVQAPSASLGYTMQVPTVTAAGHTNISAPDASLAYTMQVPTVSTGVKVTAPDASLSYTFHVPTVTAVLGKLITVPDASLGYTLRVPTVATGVKVTVPDASVLYQCRVPTVTAGAVSTTDHLMGRWTYSAAGKLVFDTAAAITNSQHGIPYTADSKIAAHTTNAIASYTSGIPFDAGGRVCIEAAAVDHTSNGIPRTANDRVAVEAAAIQNSQNGLPFTANGRIAIETL